MNSITPDRKCAPIGVGECAPAFELRNERGETMSLGDYRGQTLVLAFCPDEWDPARPQQLAFVNQVFRRLPDRFEAIAVSRDGAMIDLDLGSHGQLRFPMLQDRSINGEASRLFGVEGQDAVFVIDGDGVVRWRHVGFAGASLAVDEWIRSNMAPEGEMPAENSGKSSNLSRREFLVTAAAIAFAFTLFPKLAHAETRLDAKQAKSSPVTLNINGHDQTLNIEPRVTLLDALRDRAELTGTKKGCDHGQCGACTVLIDGRRVNSCLLLATMQQGKSIRTIEGLADGADLHPMQEAFIKHDGLQCGYCTPGQVMSAVACVHEGHANNEDQIKTWMSGNICRCGAYVGIREAINEARAETLRRSIK